MSEEEKAAQLAKLKIKIPFDEDIFVSEKNWNIILDDLLEDSKYIALETLYPFADDFDSIELPKKYYNWQLRCCVELYNLADKAGYTNYTENSIHWSKLVDGLSNHLMWKLTSHAKAPSRATNDEEGD